MDTPFFQGYGAFSTRPDWKSSVSILHFPQPTHALLLLTSSEADAPQHGRDGDCDGEGQSSTLFPPQPLPRSH